jgi:nucleosome binding factor SPN SPT16 subunit
VKSIKEDPEEFVDAGGWNFLDAGQHLLETCQKHPSFCAHAKVSVCCSSWDPLCLFVEASDSEDGSDSVESEFAPSDASEEGDSDDGSSSDESLFSEDGEDGSEVALDSDEESGLDWDELEERAAAEDDEAELSEEEKPMKRKGKK